MVLVDSNVLVDWLTRDPKWYTWSSEQLDVLIDSEGVGVNQIILAEVAVNFTDPAKLQVAMPATRFQRLSLPFEAAFLAGHAFRRYRQQEKGQKRSPMPDFYIGAHASVAALRLLTRDTRRYRTYFPDVQLITPPAA